ncbi:SiaC family regulatory phosphoprotein [Ekhidna sp.]|uniref:SiaC family regulatory phosphoprotein n=1 Tax=Ekhidna sp. TaxID=2608089 RepID=UPI003CCBDE47
MDYFKKATQTSPAVMMDAKTRSALISGVCTCSDLTAYSQVITDMKSKLESFPFIDLNIKLKVFNVRAAKSLLDLLKSIKAGLGHNHTTIHWYYEKDDLEMKEMANDYSELLELEFDISDN